MCDHIVSWVSVQQTNWSDGEKVNFLNELPLDHCIVMDHILVSKLPLGHATPSRLMSMIKENVLYVYLYQKERHIVVTMIQPKVIMYRFEYTIPEPVEEPMDSPRIIEPAKAPETAAEAEVEKDDDLEVVRLGEYCLVKDTTVVIDIDKYCILGYLSNGVLVKEETEQTKKVGIHFDLPFSA